MRGLAPVLLLFALLTGACGCGGPTAVTPSNIGKAEALGDPVEQKLQPKNE